jgi:phosphoribosylformylglycinamidine synthase
MAIQQILFFEHPDKSLIAVGIFKEFSTDEKEKLSWLFGDARLTDNQSVRGIFIGPRREMITPWSTNAVEITQNMGIKGISRVEEFFPAENENPDHDPMLQRIYHGLDQDIFTIHHEPEPVREIIDVAAYNEQEGLALSAEEIVYLNNLSRHLGRRLTDSEVFGFSQVNSEHCRHKIFNGTFIVDGTSHGSSLFSLIRRTTELNPNHVISAYKDNCAFLSGPEIEQFAPATHDKPDDFCVSKFDSVLSLKAETHNFPTTVEPFNGASTGTGGEIRDRIAGGKGALPVAGTAVYMTSYPRPEGPREWEKVIEPRKWLYHSPEEILIKASNGASDFGNKFGQPLICGSVLTFEHFNELRLYGYDKVIMLAGGIGLGKKKDSTKSIPGKGDAIVLLGGDNYRIGMGGGAVSSVDTGAYDSIIELNAVQRANPEMQKRVYNALRAMTENDRNPIISLHDHGAGGHLNCLSELVETTGGKIDISKLPIGDPTLSAREIIGNESQERMGLVMSKNDLGTLSAVAERERAPIYIIGEVTGDHQFTFYNPVTGEQPIDLQMCDFFGKPPGTIIRDNTITFQFRELEYDPSDPERYLSAVLQLEEVACKDWLTNKVDRSVTGRIAKQQCAGELQLPLNNLGAIALDYRGKRGMATALGHAPASGLVNAAAGSVLSIAEALTNIVWAPLTDGLQSVSLSANWMWPCKNPGEDARLYEAVKAASDFAVALGINIPTGKDSLSMTQKYPGRVVYSPGTVIITSAAEVEDIRNIVEPVIKNDCSTSLIWIDMSGMKPQTGGSALAQTLNSLGSVVPTVCNPEYFAEVFNILQTLVRKRKIIAGHDISAGGMITTLLEMCFANREGGLAINLTEAEENDTVKLLYSQNPGVIIQVSDESETEELLLEREIRFLTIGHPVKERKVFITIGDASFNLDIDHYRSIWYRSSYLLDRKQSGQELAKERYDNHGNKALEFNFKGFKGSLEALEITHDRNPVTGIRAAIIREKGVNGDREMAYALWLAGFDVRDVHMTDLIFGRETLDDINMIVFVGGFSNSDVLGSAKGWAGAFRYNEKARVALENFYRRDDTLSLGVCNGCQLMAELGLIVPEHKEIPRLEHNSSHKFESDFLGVTILPNHSVMMSDLEGMELGIWVAHGEGKFVFPYSEDKYHVIMKYSRSNYPSNPNGSMYDIAGICSADGRHLAMMPHLERAYFPWQCAYYPHDRQNDDVTPWIKAFVNARKWVERLNEKKVFIKTP